MLRQEIIPPQPINKARPEKHLLLSDVLAAIKRGDPPSHEVGLAWLGLSSLSKDARATIIDKLATLEQVSPAFAAKLLDDERFRTRVLRICKNFVDQAEPLTRLEQVEIFTLVMPEHCHDVKQLMHATNPAEQFPNLQPLTPDEILQKHLQHLREAVETIHDPDMKKHAETLLQKAFSEIHAGPITSDISWKNIAASSWRLRALTNNNEMRWLYEQANDGKQLQDIGRRVQLYWHASENGQRMPAISVEQAGKNPKTDKISRLGCDIEREASGQRVLKNIVVIIDENTRNTNAGMQFLLRNLPLIKTYALDAACFIANIKIGSYAWTRIADLDLEAMQHDLSAKAHAALGPEPWPEKKLKGKIFEELILPTFEQNMARAVHSLVASITDTTTRAQTSQRLSQRYFTELYEPLKSRALHGEATMQELADMGKNLDTVHFNKLGALVDKNDPEAHVTGHVGKAAVMGIAWKARLKLDKPSLFQLVDKLNKGAGLVTQIKKTGQKIGLALSL